MMRRLIALISFRNLETTAVLLLLSVLSARPAWAKKVMIQWNPMPGASQYELEVQREGKTISKKKLEESVWNGDLPFGMYVYQIRAYDRVKRPGKWTELMPLVVMPAPPVAQGPDDGKKVMIFGPTAGTALKWSATKGASRYRVEILKGGVLFSTQIVDDAQLTLKSLPPGEYQWKVTTIVKPKGRLPASFEAKQWESKPSDVSSFRIELGLLEKPSISFPVGSILPPSDGNVRFKWKKVDGAEAYELQVFAKDRRDPKARIPATAPKALSVQTVPENTASVKLPPLGEYTWRVRALANIDEKKNPESVGPESVADFALDKNAAFLDGSGYVAFSTMLAPYSYQVISAASSSNGTAASSAVTLRGSGEYWFKPQWGVGAAFESTSFQISDLSFSRIGYELVAKYRMNFGGSRYPWSLTPKLGVEERDYVEVFPPGFAVTSETVQAYGVQIGLDLRKQFSERFSLGAKLAYFLPLIPSAQGIGGLTTEASYRNFSIGTQCLYWLNTHWGLGAGAYLEHRSLSFSLQGAPVGTAPEQLFMDGVYFFGSVVYRFGR